MKPEVRRIDGHDLLVRAKHDIEALMKQKEETVQVDRRCRNSGVSF